MNKIEFYKETEFKETPIGKIPRDWEANKLGSICKFKRGFSYRSDQITNNQTPIRFITINDVEKEGGLKRSAERIYIKEPSEVNPEFLVNNGDVLIANTDMAKGLIIGAPILIKNLGEKCAYSMDLTKLIFDKTKIDGDFLFYYLMHPQMRQKMKSSAQGTNVLHLNHEFISEFLIPLPPVVEQRAVAEVLSTVDEAIQKNNEVIAKTERLKKSLLQELLTKGIGHKDFKHTEIGRIPTEWEVTKLASVGDFRYGITTSAVKEDTGIMLLRITDIRNGGIKWSGVPYCKVTESEFNKYKLEVGDVLFARIGATTGKTCYIDQPVRGVFGSYLIKFVPKIKIDTKFLYFYTQSWIYWNQVNRKKEGQLKKGLNTKMLGSLLILLPPFEEQQKITEILSIVDKKLELERNVKARLERIKQGLMDLLLTGKIRVKVN
ncbi:MAG: restriction endonuclease subunit S [Candidatus Methanomethylicaceae archaeon]